MSKYSSSGRFTYTGGNTKINKSYDKNHVQPTVFEHGGPHDPPTEPTYVSSPDDPRYQQYLLDLKNYQQRNIDIQDEKSDAIARYNKLYPKAKDARPIDEYLQSVLMLEPLSKPTQEYVYDETEAAALRAEEAFAKKQALEQQLQQEKPLNNPTVTPQHKIYEMPYWSQRDAMPEKVKKPVAEERRLTPMTFKHGGKCTPKGLLKQYKRAKFM